MYDISDFWNWGDRLRELNQRLKNAAYAMGRQPLGTVPREIAQALQNAQANYFTARDQYAYGYRLITGTYPEGLAAIPLVPLAIIAAIIAALANAFRYASVVEEWLTLRQQETASGVIQMLPPEQRASVASQIFPQGTEDWLKENVIWVAAGGLALILISRR